MVWVVFAVLRDWNQVQLDQTALYYASRLFALGQFGELYSTDEILLWNEAPLSWRELSDSLGHPSEEGLTAYVYPPLWLWVLSPFSSALPPLEFYNGANALFATVFALGLVAIARAFAQDVPLLVWVVVGLLLVEVTIIGQTAFRLGQPHVLIVGLTLMAFAAYIRGNALSAGGLLALATAMKLSPIVFVAIFVADRNWRAVAAFVVIGGALGLLSIAVAGWPLHQLFLDRLATLEHHILLSRINLSVQATITFLQAGKIWYEGYIWVDLPPSLVWISPALTAGAVLIVFALRWRSNGKASLLASLLFLSFIVPIGSPLGWVHYLLLTVGFLPGIIAFLPPRASTLALMLFGLAYCVPIYQLLLPQHLGVMMIYSAIWALVFCMASLAIAFAGNRSASA